MGAAKEFLEYLFGRLKDTKPVVKDVEGQVYAVKADGTLGDPVRELAPQFTKPTLRLSTLSGLVAAYLAGLDGLPRDSVAFHVESPTRVSLLATQADEWGQRHVWAVAKHELDCPFRFGVYLDAEAFLIAFRASFYFNDNAVKIQQLLSTLTSESSVSIADDGLSQVVTAKSGTVTRTAVELPAEIPLVPWRTFRDAAPVESKFLLRLKGVKDGVPQAALFEVDAKWQLDTINSVANYLDTALPDATVIA